MAFQCVAQPRYGLQNIICAFLSVVYTSAVRVEFSNQGLTEVPRPLPPNTTDLLIKENPLVTLGPDSFLGLDSVTRIEIRLCQLTSIDDTAFQSCSSLLEVDLSFNNLHSLPESFGPNTHRLVRLSISNNNITFLPNRYFQTFTSLDTLILDNCGLVVLENDFLFGLTNLRLISFSGQTIANFSTYTPALEEIYISDFIGESIPDENVAHLPALTKFVMSGNGGVNDAIPSFRSSVHLSIIDVTGNPETIHDLSHVFYMQGLLLSTNNLQCDHRLCWILFENWNTGPAVFPLIFPCNLPEYALGKRILDMTKLEMRCYESKL